MDILAHALWVGAGVTLARRRWPMAATTAAATVVAATLPDVLHLLPLIGWWLLGGGSFGSVGAYALALPGRAPALPARVGQWSQHLHCVAHSALVAMLVTLLLWGVLRALWVPLLGWWSHILIDVPTHSADYYPSPVFYPLTQWGFDGLAWNTPWFLVINYLVLAALWAWLWRDAKARARHAGQRSHYS